MNMLSWKAPATCRDAVAAFKKFASHELRVEMQDIRPTGFYIANNTTTIHGFNNVDIDPYLGRTLHVQYTLAAHPEMLDDRWSDWYGGK